MRILMFSADPNILDAGSAAAKRMVEYGRRVEKLDILVLVRKVQTKSPTINRRGNVFVYVKSGIFWRFLAGFFLARRLAAKNKYDLLVAQDIEHAGICRLLSFLFNIKWQMQIHADIFSPYFVKHRMSNRLREWLAKFLIPRASCIRVVSERIKSSIVKKFNNLESKITVLPILPVLMDLNVEPKRFSEFDKTILIVSRLASEKNIGLAIEAMSEVVKKHPKTGLIIVGDGPKFKNIKNQISNLKINKNVRLEGWQKDTAVYYKGADIFLLTSLYEGWGMSVLDAARCGVAVVMTDVGLAGELIKDDEDGLVVPVNDKDALVAAILRLLENDILRRNLIESAAKKIKELPSAGIYYQKIVESWQKC